MTQYRHRAPYRSWTEDEIAAVLRGIDEGKTFKMIGDDMGVSRNMISSVVRRYGGRLDAMDDEASTAMDLGKSMMEKRRDQR